ncbi:hypothetical protein JX265_001325 [Neoarthrinium moseri]|uniref:Uncharacterized protein n=1 Tax=Neoarthrinium moseri TaxID=1658444 RepID=A0A9P9WXU0_9PEZI|nr:uncharacterized protein JN550_010777 [Neoarthrinium moseri]KAI1842017.1 hypothetical protein JX266_011772 [Neoarthrinium moseri]KAI1861707.1 hypothetical protein JN550_010777 [Neoarthrinium moseri]KAI1881085.1 hypothetical protein JX265_001325 [Neoarthrinium moseri]
MAEVMSKTPSPPPRVRTPQTPKFGTFGDNWEPYSPRKSARIANRTPSPHASTFSAASRNSASRKSTFSTPGASPQKKRAPAMDSVRRASGVTLTAEGSATAADLLGISSRSQNKTTTAMLPTPAKTPRKQSDEKVDAGVRAIARNLFSSEPAAEALPSPRKKKAKKYTGISLESFRAEDAEEDIAIFTDSRDRLPKVDDSAENPFFGETVANPEPTRRRSTRPKKVVIPGSGRVPVEDAVNREDGTVYVFRGKTFWKPNSDVNPADELDVDGESSIQRSGSPPRRTTRSSIKPRLLFPPAEKLRQSHNTDDEEAATDIEDHIMNPTVQLEEEQVDTPVEQKAPDTPAAPRFAPASPPTTGRATRVSQKPPAEHTPVKRPSKARSPFDSWRRAKSGTAPHGQKREAEAALPNEGASKRQRA